MADFNGDGFDDMAIGYANYAPPAFPGTTRGRVVIVYGGDTPLEQNIDDLASKTVILNQSDNAQFGYALSAGDVTDDGLPDLVVGAPGARSNKGVVTVLENSLLATPGSSSDVNTDGANPSSGEGRYVGDEEGASYGSSVLCVDTTGDGAAEIIGGAPNATVNANFNSGKVYVAFGANFVSGTTLDIVSESEVYTYLGASGSTLGSSLTAGDFDGNGSTELAMGAPGASTVYVVFSVDPGPNTLDLADSGSFPSIARFTGLNSLGTSMDSGDVDGDGFDDLLLGTPLYTPSIGLEGAGGATAYAGRASLQGQLIDLSANPPRTFDVTGGGADARYGFSVALGDITGDGKLDFCIGAPFAKTFDGTSDFAGRIAVMGGTYLPNAGSGTFDFNTLSPDVALFGAGANTFLGATLNAQGDLDGDGLADLIMTEALAPNDEATGSGQVHTLYGDGTAGTSSATEALFSGDTQRIPLGGPLTPVVRASISFSGGDGNTVSATITRSNAGISNLGNGLGTNVAPVLWNLSTTRTGWTSAKIALEYSNAEVVGFSEDDLALYQAAAPDGPWVEVPSATVTASANRVTFSTDTLGYFALISKAPVISLAGELQNTLECGGTWTEPGYSAAAADGDDLTDVVVIGGDTIDSTQLGSTYTITYDVEDGQGKSALTRTRTVEIIDTRRPEFLNESVRYVEAGSAYVDTFVVEDCENLDSQVVVTGDTVDTNALETYTRFFNVTDSSGNAALQSEVSVIVEDSTPPVITLEGSDTVEVPCGGAYTELGATATDWDANLGPVQVAGDVNTSVSGSYEINYDVTDTSGNIAVRVVRTVNVVDTGKPVINLSYYTLEVPCGAPSHDLPVQTVEDCQPGLVSEIVLGGLEAVDLDTIGTYPITFDVSDAAGNSAEQVTLELKVVDKTKPQITIQGANPLEISCGETYSEPGATATDNCSGLAGPVQVVSTPVNTNAAGTYAVEYQVADLLGNVANATRTVKVIGFCGTGIVEDCPAESDVAYRPMDNTIINGIAQPSEDGLDTLFEYYYSSDNPPVGKVTWWGYGMDANDLPCQRTPNTFRIAFHDTLSLQTGIVPRKNAVYFEEVTPIVEDTGFVTNENIPLLRYTATLAQPFRYQNDQCCAQLFISIKGLGNPDCPFQWYVSNDDDGFHLAGPDAENTTPQDTGDMAFCLEPAPELEGEGEPADSLECSSSSVYPQPVDLGGFGNSVNSVSYFRAYDNFTSASDLIGGVAWWGTLTDELATKFSIIFYESGGDPGQVVNSFEVVPLRESTGVTVGGSPVYRFTAGLRVPVNLGDGWITVALAEDEPGLFRWYSSLSGDGNSRLDQPTSVTQLDRAFCLLPALPGQSADPNNDRVISLSEVLRVVQFYNADYYGCLFGTEDGYGVEESDEYCGYHSGDYSPADWKFNLSELLRLIQFYNLGSYSYCEGESSEDGFCG